MDQTNTATEKKYEYEEIEIARVDLNFDQLETWTSADEDKIPICSFLSLYEASGMTQAIEQFTQSDSPLVALLQEGKIVSLDNLACNFYTMQRMRNLIVDNWSCYGLNIDKDEHIFWDPSKWYPHKKHYKKQVTANIRNSINTDFANFCPRIDDELPDNVLAFRVYEKKEIEENTSDAETITDA